MQEFRLPGPLVLLPPIGAGAELLRPQRRAFRDQLITPPRWIEADKHEGIERYARRMLPTLALPGDDQPVFLGGVSSGGALALEMAALMDPAPAGVFLLGSLRSARAMPMRVQIGEHLQHVLPGHTLGRLMPHGALAFGMLDGLDDDQTTLLRRVARAADPALVQWAGVALFDWDRDATFPEGFPPIHQIHGRHDWVLPPRLNPDVDKMIPGGRHLIHLSHPRAVNRYIMERAWDTVDAAPPPAARTEPGAPAWNG